MLEFFPVSLFYNITLALATSNFNLSGDAPVPPCEGGDRLVFPRSVTISWVSNEAEKEGNWKDRDPSRESQDEGEIV